MTAKLMTLCLFVASAAAIVGCSEDPMEGAPELVCEWPVHDFGEASNTEVVQHVFVLKNQGTTPVRIGRVKPSCGCTVGTISDELVHPGKQATVAVQVSLLGLRGRIREKLAVESDDPHQPRIQLYVEGTVTEDIVIMPARVSFLGIAGDAEVSRTVNVLVKNPDLELHINKLEPDTPYFVPELELIERSKSYRIRIRAKPPLPEGIVSGRIRLLTDNATCPTIDIPVRADVWGELVVFPEEIVLSSDVGRNDAVSPYVAVIPGKTKAFELKSVEPPVSSITATTVPLGQWGYKIELTIPVVTKDLEGRKLRIRTNVDGMEEILVPFRIVDSPGPRRKDI